MNNIVTTDINTNVVVVTAPGPSGPPGPAGPAGSPGTITGNTGVNSTGSSIFSGSVTVIGTLTVTGSNTFINIGPARFTGSVDISGSLTAISASAQYFSGSGAGLSNIPASAISGLNVSTFRISTGSISASVQPGATSFILNSGITNLFTVSNTGLGTFNNGLTVLNGNTLISSPNITLVGSATLNGQPITTAGDLTLNQIKSGNITASVSTGANSFILEDGNTTLFSVSNTGILSGSGANLFNIPASGITGLNLSRTATGSVSASVNIGNTPFQVTSGSSTLMEVSSSGYVTASGYLGDGSRLSGVSIPYVNTGDRITSIEVADFDTNVAVTFVGGALKFVFGTPVVPSAPQISFNGTFDTNRFNLQTDNYTTTATWSVGGYSLVRASMVDLSTGIEVASTTSGTSLPFNTTTSGSQSYRIAVTASSPLDGSINIQTATTTGGTLSKGAPSNPILTPTATVQLGSTSGQIESGATGSVSFTAAYGASDNGWEKVSLVSSSNSPITVTATSTPSATLTANYQSPVGTNSPTATTSTSTSFQPAYTRIISVRYGASSALSFNETQLQDLALWDTTLGGTIGTIAKGTINPNNYQFTVTTTGNYIYIVIPSGYTLTGILNVNNSNANDISVFATPVIIGGYKVYRSNNVSATTILYKLTT
jgi:hypothetical protein